MAFRKSVALEVTNTADLISVLKTQMVNMGWVDHDDQISGSDYFVVYSDGEGDGCPYRVYLQIIKSTANILEFRRWYYWNNSTQTGIMGQYATSYSRVNVDDDASFYVWIYGNLDSIVLLTLISGTYDGVAVHRFHPVGNSAIGRVQGAVTTGTDKVIQLGTGQAANFSIGAGVSFLDAQNSSFAGRNHRSLITDINPSADTITVDEVYLAMQDQALVGYIVDFHMGIALPGTSGITMNAETYTTSGTTTVTTAVTLIEVITRTSLDPDTQSGAVDSGPSNQFISFPWRVPRGANGHIGFLSGVISKSPYSESSSYEDTCAIGLIVNEQDASGGTTSTIEASAASWGPNEFFDKVVITTGGTGSGQIRRITSNDTTSLSVSGDWSVDPDGTTQFVICRAGARHFGMGTSANSVVFQEEPAPPVHGDESVS